MASTSILRRLLSIWVTLQMCTSVLRLSTGLQRYAGNWPGVRHVHTPEYHLATQRNAVPTAIGMHPATVLPSKIRRMLHNSTCMTIQNRQTQRQRICRGWKRLEGRRAGMLMATGLPPGMMKAVHNYTMLMVPNLGNTLRNTELYPSKGSILWHVN